MRIDRLGVTGFGRFAGATLDLGPGLNIIYGHNEAGKSTLQRFMLAMLYGMQKKAQRRSFTEDAAKYRPWHGGEYRGSLVYTLQETGRSLRVERDFEPGRERVAIYDAQTGADLSGRFAMDRRKELLFAEEHLGLSEEVFRSTAWIGQMEVGKLELGRELVARVANLQESGREDLSVKSALRVLEERMREIGTDRAPTRPYARVGRLIEEKRAELERAEAAREQTMTWEAQLTEVRAVLSEMDQELAGLYRRIDWALLAEAEERLERVAAAGKNARDARRKAESLSGYAAFPVHFRDRLVRLQSEIDSTRASAGRHGARLAELEEAIRALEAQVSPSATATGLTVEAEVAALQQAQRAAEAQLPGLREEAERLADMVARLDEAIAPLRLAAEKGAQVLERVESVDRELAGLRPRLDVQTADSLQREVAALERELRGSGGWGWLAVAGVLAAAAAVAYLSLAGSVGLVSAGGLGVAAVGALAMFITGRTQGARVRRLAEAAKERLLIHRQATAQIQERMEGLERQRRQALGEVGLSDATEIRNRVVRFEQLQARRDGQQMRLDSVEREMTRLQAEVEHRQQHLERLIAGALGAAEEEVHAQPDPVAWFRQAHGRQQEAARRLEGLRREAADTERRLRDDEFHAERLTGQVSDLLSEAGVQSHEAFEESCAHHDAWRKAVAEADSLENGMRSLLGGDTPEALSAQIERLRAEAVGPEPAGRDESARLQAEARRLEARRADLNARASDLAARVETAVGDLLETADIRLELEALREERLALEEELGALELARSVITEVSAEIHREFAPKLNATMGQVVSAITGGKYRTVKIDEEASIRVITEADRTVDLLSLSGGTVDQFYFGLRIALLDLLVQGGERCPLLLDDPFVQYDEARLRSSLEYLGQISRERQIILMTCHQREVRMAQSLGVPVNYLTISDGGL